MKSERQETANNLVMYVHADTENASEFGVKLLFKNNFFKIKPPPPKKTKNKTKTPRYTASISVVFSVGIKEDSFTVYSHRIENVCTVHSMFVHRKQFCQTAKNNRVVCLFASLTQRQHPGKVVITRFTTIFFFFFFQEEEGLK